MAADDNGKSLTNNKRKDKKCINLKIGIKCEMHEMSIIFEYE